MLSPPVRRGKPRLAFGAGLLLGAVTAAAGLLVIGSLVRLPLPPAVRVALVGALAAAVALREVGAVRFRLPENRRLVPEHVDRYGPLFGPLQFGFEMGTGMRTYLPSGLPHALAAAVALLAGPLTALAAGLGFGLGRAAMTLANLRYSAHNEWDLAWIGSRGRISAVLVAAFLPVLALVLR